MKLVRVTSSMNASLHYLQLLVSSSAMVEEMAMTTMMMMTTSATAGTWLGTPARGLQYFSLLSLHSRMFHSVTTRSFAVSVAIKSGTVLVIVIAELQCCVSVCSFQRFFHFSSSFQKIQTNVISSQRQCPSRGETIETEKSPAKH